MILQRRGIPLHICTRHLPPPNAQAFFDGNGMQSGIEDCSSAYRADPVQFGLTQWMTALKHRRFGIGTITAGLRNFFQTCYKGDVYRTRVFGHSGSWAPWRVPPDEPAQAKPLSGTRWTDARNGPVLPPSSVMDVRTAGLETSRGHGSNRVRSCLPSCDPANSKYDHASATISR